MRAAAGFALAALLGACSMEADLDGTRFACEQTSECPDGYSCVADQCVPDEADDLEPASCDDASDLRDDFDDGRIDDDWVPFGDTDQDGDAVFTVDGTGGTAGVMSRCSFDLTGDRVYVHVEEVAGNGAETFFEIVTTGGNFAALEQHGSVLAARTRGGTGNRNESSSHDAIYEWWMIEGANGEIRYWIAIDDGDWQLVTSHPIPDGFEAAHVSFGLRADAESTATVEARFDDYNGG